MSPDDELAPPTPTDPRRSAQNPSTPASRPPSAQFTPAQHAPAQYAHAYYPSYAYHPNPMWGHVPGHPSAPVPVSSGPSLAPVQPLLQSQPSVPPSRPEKPPGHNKSDDEKLAMIIDLLEAWHWSLGRLLYEFFSPTRTKGQKKTPVQRSANHSARVVAFLTGQCTLKPCDIVSFWYNDPCARPAASHPEHRLAFSLDAPPSGIRHAQPSLSAWAARLCMDKIGQDAHRATKPAAGLHVRTRTSKARREQAALSGERFVPMRWSDVNSDILSTARRVFNEHCALLWRFMSHAAEQQSQPGQVVTVRHYRPIEHVVSGALSDLLFSRNNAANLLPLARGLAYFATRSEQSIYRLGSRFGTNPAYTTVVNALKTLGKDGEHWLQNASSSDIIWLMLVIDNVQHFGRQREIRDGRENYMHKGVTGTGIQALNASPLAWSLDRLQAIRASEVRYALTVHQLLEKVDDDWIARISELHWVDTLLLSALPSHVAALKEELGKRFEALAKAPVLPAETHSNIQPLRSSGCDPAQNTEMAKALLDFLNQIAQNPERWTRRVILIGGDGGTYETLLRLQKYLQTLPTEYERLEFLIPILQMWHTRWTALGRNVFNFWDSSTSQDVSSLGHSNAIARRAPPSNLKKPDFHSAMELFYLVGETRMIDCWSIVLGEDNIEAYFLRLHEKGKLPSLDELLTHARKLNETYSCSRAGAMSLEKYDDQPIASRAPLSRDLPTIPPSTAAVVAEPAVEASPSDQRAPDTASDETTHIAASTIPALPPEEPIVDGETGTVPQCGDPEISTGASPAPAGAAPARSGHKEASGFAGDRVLSNSIRLLTDFIHYRHWSRATALGHAGDLWEIFKLEVFKFAGSGHNPKYREFGLEMFIFVEFECTQELRQAIISNLLVNPSGRKGHFKEGDLLQEHLINRLDRHMQHRDKSYDDSFIRDVVTPNLHHLIEVPRQLENAVDLKARTTRHTSMHQRPEARRLLATYRRHQLHRFCAGRSNGFAAKDCMEEGLAGLDNHWLGDFLERHRRETRVFHRETPSSHATRRRAAEGHPMETPGAAPSGTATFTEDQNLQSMMEAAERDTEVPSDFTLDLPTYSPDHELGPHVAGTDFEMVFDGSEITWQELSEQLNMVLGEFSEGADGLGQTD